MATNTNSGAELSSAADGEQRKKTAGMTSRPSVASEAALMAAFLGKQRCNITFVVESSEKTRAALGSVKSLLIQTLLTKASLRDSFFNIMAFSGKVTCWSHHMRPCAPDTVYMALSWIRSISCSPGSDLLAALSAALADPACHTVHLLCQAPPEQPQAVLAALPSLAAGRPVNVFYLQDSGGQLDSSAGGYLQCVSHTTGGSCCVIPVGLNGELEQVLPLCVLDTVHRTAVPTVSPVKCCCPSPSGLIPHNTPSPLLSCSLGNPPLPVTPCITCGQTLGQPMFFPGCRVLARREVDGLYYSGTTIQQVQGHRGVWVVEFDHPGGTSVGAVCSHRQLVCSLDMVDHSRAHTRCLVPGDAVLSPWEPDLRRYGPGRVMAATEPRGIGAGSVSSLRVLMWNGCVSLLPGSLVLPISASHHDRIVRELQIMTSSRCCSWFFARRSSCPPQLFCSDRSVTNPWPHMCPPSCRSSFVGMDGCGRAEQDKEVGLRDTHVRQSDPEVPSSSSSSSFSEEGTRFSPPAVKLKSKQQRPPWRYWSRTGPEPQHRQPGTAVPKKTSQPLRFSFPAPQIITSPNHSSLFQSLPGAKGRRSNTRDVFGTTSFKPRPPVGPRPFSGSNTTSVYT